MLNFQFSKSAPSANSRASPVGSKDICFQLNSQSKPQFSIFKGLKIKSLETYWKLVIENWNSQRHKSGFTLLEMVVSLGIFSALVVAAIGITLGVSNAHLRASQIQTTQDNIRFSLELITKEMRTGSGYTLTAVGNSCGGNSNPVGQPSEITFDTSLGDKRTYYLDIAGKRIMRILNGSTNCAADAVPFTAEDVEVERFLMRLSGSLPGPSDGQPRVTVTLKVKAVDPRKQGSSMEIETTVVQRLRDL